MKSELPEYENTDSLLSPYEEAKDYLCRIKALYQKFDSNRLFMDRIEKISEIESQIDKDNSVSQDQIDFLSLVCEEMEKYYISINKAKHSS